MNEIVEYKTIQPEHQGIVTDTMLDVMQDALLRGIPATEATVTRMKELADTAYADLQIEQPLKGLDKRDVEHRKKNAAIRLGRISAIESLGLLDVDEKTQG